MENPNTNQPQSQLQDKFTVTSESVCTSDTCERVDLFSTSCDSAPPKGPGTEPVPIEEVLPTVVIHYTLAGQELEEGFALDFNEFMKLNNYVTGTLVAPPFFQFEPHNYIRLATINRVIFYPENF